MKPAVSLSVLLPPFQAVPCCSVLICTTQGKSELKGQLVSVPLCSHTSVAFQCETPCQESSFLTSHPAFPFSNLAWPVLCHVSAPANGQEELLFRSGGAFLLTAHRRWTDLPATATYNSSLLHEIPSFHWLAALRLLFRVSCRLIYPVTFTRLTFPPTIHTFWKKWKELWEDIGASL